MSFKFYKFCQTGVLTFPTAIFAATSLIYNITEIAWCGCLLIGVLIPALTFLPIISLLYPFTIAVYLVAAIATLSGNETLKYILIAVLILHIIRSVSMLYFSWKDPETSRAYDTAIRNGYKL